MNCIFDENIDLYKEWTLYEKKSNKLYIKMVKLPIDKATGYPMLKINVVNTETDEDGTLIGMIDTGAARSLMKKRVFDALGLSLKEGEAKATGIGNGSSISLHGYADMGINVPNLMGQQVLSYTFYVENDVEDEDKRPWDVLLGTDFLKHFNFEYKGQEGVFGLDFLI